MAQLVQFEGQIHQFPDDFSQADIQRALSSVPRRDAQPRQRSGMFDDLIPNPRKDLPPLPPGYTLDQSPARAPGTGPKFIPVDHDPFAPPAAAPAAGPKLVPVDHDPFAQSNIRAETPVQVRGPDGAVVEFPAGTSQETMQAAMRRHYGGTQTAPGRPTPDSNIQFVGTTPATPTAPARVVMDTTGRPSAMHSLAVGAQGVGAGTRDIVLAPFDLAAGAQNLVTGGINKLFGTNIPSAIPASQLAEKITGPYSIPESEMSPSEKLGYNVNRFGTQALGTGAMLAARAPAVAAATQSSPTVAGRTLDNLSRPYTAAPARTLAGDAIGGAGAGVAVDAADNYIPDHPVAGDWVKTTANVVAPLVGAVGANTIQGAVEGLGGLLRNLATRAFTSAPREVPLSPTTKAPYANADVERAAATMQSAVTGSPRALAQDIRENTAELTNPARPGEIPVDASALPTSALLSRDPGLLRLEQGARTKTSSDFIKRDQGVKEAAADRVNSLRDKDADLGAVMRRAGAVRAERLAPAEQRVNQLEDLGGRVDVQRREQGAAFTPIANSEAKANASRRFDQALVNDTYIPARTEKNRQFDEAPGRAAELPADDIFTAIDRVRRNANGLAPGTLPNDFMRRLDELRPVLDDAGNNVGGPGTAGGGDLADLRKFIEPARQRAQQSGNFDLADNLGALKSAINRTIEAAPGYAEANANYRQFADRFRPEPNDEAARFTREIDRGGRDAYGYLNRGSTPPSETASRFLSSPEKAATVNRIMEGAPAGQAGIAAVRDYLRSDLAMSALNPDGTLNLRRTVAWARANADVLAQFPQVRQGFDDIIAATQRGEQLAANVQTALQEARAKRTTLEGEIERSAVSTLFREDPRKVAQSVLNDRYGGGKRIDEINELMGSDEVARRGWKAAMAEVLTNRVRGIRQVGEAVEVQFARLAKEFKDNEDVLAKTFTPEEMNTLRQGHKLLEYFKEAEKRSTTGSDTAEKWNVPGWAQLAVRHFKGDLAGGGLIKRFKLLLEMLPTNKQSADEIVHMASFNPDLAAFLLERPLKNANVPQYNTSLRRLIAADNAAREQQGDVR
jgi:hypothetical protein